MGDNRNNSNDAREWETHYVSRDEVLGKAWFRYYPSIKVIKLNDQKRKAGKIRWIQRSSMQRMLQQQ